MKYRISIALVVAAAVAALERPAAAQFWPGYGYGWGGSVGAAAMLGTDYRQAAAMQAVAQARQTGQQAAMAQNAVVGLGIRNTLSSEADRRTDAILSQRQANQDWWFQYQAQQSAQRRAAPSSTAAYGVPLPAAGGFAPPGDPPPAAMDVIQWPPILQEPCFAPQRARIEAPYRRTSAGLSRPTADDYRTMVGVVEDMKAVLEWRLGQGLETNAYNTAKEFLNRLGQEAAARAPTTATTARP